MAHSCCDTAWARGNEHLDWGDEVFITVLAYSLLMGRERTEGVFFESKAVCPCTDCLQNFLETRFELADLAPHYLATTFNKTPLLQYLL